MNPASKVCIMMSSFISITHIVKLIVVIIKNYFSYRASLLLSILISVKQKLRSNKK